MKTKKEIESESTSRTLARLAQYSEGCKRDVRNLLSLKTLRTLNDRDLTYLALKMAGNTNRQVASVLGVRLEIITHLVGSDRIKKAIAEAAWNLQAGIVTAADVSEVAEAEVLTAFYELALDVEVPIEWRFRFGKEVLDYHLNRIKAMPAPALLDTTYSDKVELLRSRGELIKRMSGHLAADIPEQDEIHERITKTTKAREDSKIAEPESPED